MDQVMRELCQKKCFQPQQEESVSISLGVFVLTHSYLEAHKSH